MSNLYEGQRKAYTTIVSKKKEYGLFYKTCFHVHTPESHDYHLLDTWDEEIYRNKSAQDVLQICYEKHVFPSMITLDSFNSTLVEQYRDKKEMLSFLLLASELMDNDIAVVVVADHHTIAGVSKLENAIKLLYKMKSRSIYPEVILGIEISCADRNHVVGFFENTNKRRDSIRGWLDLHLFNEIDGSFETSKEVLDFISQEGGIGYIAHIDTSNTFGEKFLSGAYKKKLFESQNIIGISDLSKMEYIRAKIQDFSESNISFVLDNDAHDIRGLVKNHMWIKGQKRNYQALREAFSDYDICVSFVEASSNKSFIKGLFIENRDSGYLCGKEQQGQFCLNLSDELNCFIGGRGTGKSTALELIEYVLSQRCKSREELQFLCAHGNTYLLYDYMGSEYLIKLSTPVKGEKDNILQCFGQNPSDRYKFYYHYNSDEIRDYTLKNYIEVFRINQQDGTVLFEKQSDKRNLLKKFFDTRYSVNELVATAGGDRINSFLYNILFENKTLSSPETVITVRSISGLMKMLSNIQTALEKRLRDVDSIIAPFNNTQRDILRIVYVQDNPVSDPPIGEWMWGKNENSKQYYSIRKVKYNLTHEAVEQYLLALYAKLGIFDFLNLIFTKNVCEAQKNESIISFCDEMTIEMVEREIVKITSANAQDICADIFSCLITNTNIRLVLDYLKKYVNEIERFSLEFNISNHESVKKEKAQYKDVRILSLGQKVVAMLSFILGYSDYSQDYRPLIIDQPEDNLDNQYIYKNLVKQLRDSKGKRQVIIATHSATLVTNTKAEQVCVMCSNGANGWIEARGFTGEAKIKKHIINYLEGGVESFKHKALMYRDVIGPS